MTDYFCLIQTHRCSSLSFQISYLFVESNHLGFGLQFEFSEASFKLFFLILWIRSKKNKCCLVIKNVGRKNIVN